MKTSNNKISGHVILFISILVVAVMSISIFVYSFSKYTQINNDIEKTHNTGKDLFITTSQLSNLAYLYTETGNEIVFIEYYTNINKPNNYKNMLFEIRSLDFTNNDFLINEILNLMSKIIQVEITALDAKRQNANLKQVELIYTDEYINDMLILNEKISIFFNTLESNLVGIRDGVHRESSISFYALCISALSFVLLIIYVQRKARLKALFDQQCFRALISNSNLAVVEWDLHIKDTNIITSMEDLFDPSKNLDVKKDYNDIVSMKMIHPDDVPKHQELLKQLRLGSINLPPMRLRLLNKNGDYSWCYHNCTTIKSPKGKYIKSIGFFENIDAQVKKEEEMRLRADIDTLSGLYNKDAAAILISEIFKNSTADDIHGLICIDLDNFKEINDNFGHLYGDSVLEKVAKSIKRLFRSTDVLGRFGGDEFVLLIKNLSDEKFFKNKLKALTKSTRISFTQNGITCHLTASIGASMYPKDGTTYDELYKKADEAAYNVKRNGKNHFEMYS